MAHKNNINSTIDNYKSYPQNSMSSSVHRSLITTRNIVTQICDVTD